MYSQRWLVAIVLLFLGSVALVYWAFMPPSLEKTVAQLGQATASSKLVVVLAEGSNARIYAYQKQGEDWKEVLQTVGFVGRNGVSTTKKEGDGTSPAGLYAFGRAFGLGADPASLMPYSQLTGKEFWVDDPQSEYYNTWVNSSVQPKDWSSAKDLSKETVAYAYAIVIEYNTAPVVKGAGSALFLHCTLQKPTSGCVSVPEPAMIQLLHFIDGHTKIAIARSVQELQTFRK